MRQTTDVANKETNDVASPELRLTKDSRGHRHLHDGKGRFVKQNGTVNSVVADRLEGKKLLPGVDQRSLPYQRYKEIVREMAVDAGGEQKLTAARKQLIKRFAAASVLAEQLEVRIAKGELVNIQDFSSLSSTLVRLATRVGIERVAKNVTDLGDYLRQHDGEPTPADLTTEVAE